ncbi:MAG: TrkH family potassium uptake protein [Pirellulaceae bacterium]
MAKLTGSLVQYPARVSVAWYLGLIALGSLALRLPMCHSSSDRPITLLDAIFTSTSATCVTGLAVRSTRFDYSPIGQAVILVLIQLGGIGIMTVTTFVMFHLGTRQSLRDRLVLSETLGADSRTDLRRILRAVILLTLSIEAVGFVILAVRNLFDRELAWGDALWQALFHSISAFCNAGFALHDDSLTRYQTDPVVNFTIMTLILLGGIGFPVILDIRRNWKWPWRERWDRLHLHSKTMLIGTAALLVLGTVSFLLLEWDGVLVDVPPAAWPMVALFHSVTCRTAGFNTVNIGELTNAMLFISILLMAIGAGPGSTAGGFKVSTLMVLVYRAWMTFRGYATVNVFRRTIPRSTMARAVATAALFTVVAFVALTTLLIFEQSGRSHLESKGLFLDALFEVVSALGTVGLSIDFTSRLTTAGRWIVILLMFLGRLGPITAFAALSRGERDSAIEYPNEEPLIG